MIFNKIIATLMLGGIGLAAIYYIYATIVVAKQLIGQFKCKKCGRHNKILTGKCVKCDERLHNSEYKFRSTFFGKRNLKNENGKAVLSKAIRFVCIDGTILLMIVLVIIALIFQVNK